MMRFCLFILLVVRISTSFLVPISFPRCTPYALSHTLLGVSGNGGKNNDPLVSLDYFVSVVESLNQEYTASGEHGESEIFHIISRGLTDLPETQQTATRVFYDPTHMEIFIGIVQENSDVDASKIRNLFSNDQIVPIPPHMTESLCGFPMETLPPFGSHSALEVSRCNTILDKSLIQQCRDDHRSLTTSAGHPNWKLLLGERSIDALNEMDYVQIADIVRDYDANGEEEKNNSDGKVWEVSTTPQSETGSTINIPSMAAMTQKGPQQVSQKPFFTIDGPSMNIARLVIRQKDISNPLSPVFFTTVGRIGDISIRTKRSLRCKFLPPAPTYLKDSNGMGNDDDCDDSVWSSATRSAGITVDLVFGKVFLQSFGTKQGEKMIETIQEGQLLLIEAKTNPGQRESLEKWVNDSCLEVVVMNCQHLSPNVGVSERDKDGDRDSKSGKTKNAEAPSSLPTLSLDNIFDEHASIKLVNDLDSITEFSDDVSKLLSRARSSTDSNPMSSLVGIDCEWQPREFMENPNLPQPTLLLQISFHELQIVYLLDLQTLLRPLMSPGTTMNEMETELSNALSPLMQSEFIIKVGYQLSSDLRRTFASYPHLPCFQEVQSTLEISSFIKKVLHISKQKKSRYITTSLSAMTSHYLGMTVDKECQLTDWGKRDLAPEQLEYAALDAAVTPKLLEKVLESVEAHISIDHLLLEQESDIHGPIIRRHDGDEAMVKEIVSCRFLCLPETSDEATIYQLKAKQIVGPSWIATSTWTTTQEPPVPRVFA